jgi:hypothetical protein
MKQELANVVVVEMRETEIKFFGKISLRSQLHHQPLNFSMNKFSLSKKKNLLGLFIVSQR